MGRLFEGDSAHSAINSAIITAGNVTVPSELKSIIKLSRRNHPCDVNSLENTDFLDFMGLSKSLRILSVRKDDERNNINWPSMVEYLLLKNEPNKIFFKQVMSLMSSVVCRCRDVTFMPEQNPKDCKKTNQRSKNKNTKI